MSDAWPHHSEAKEVFRLIENGGRISSEELIAAQAGDFEEFKNLASDGLNEDEWIALLMATHSKRGKHGDAWFSELMTTFKTNLDAEVKRSPSPDGSPVKRKPTSWEHKESKAREIFKRIAGEDSDISSQELIQAHAEGHEELFANADTDGSGNLTEDEWASFLQKEFKGRTKGGGKDAKSAAEAWFNELMDTFERNLDVIEQTEEIAQKEGLITPNDEASGEAPEEGKDAASKEEKEETQDETQEAEEEEEEEEVNKEESEVAEEEEEMVEEGNDESEEAPEPAGLTPEEKAERAAVKKAKQEAREAKEQVEDYPYSPVVTLTLTMTATPTLKRTPFRKAKEKKENAAKEAAKRAAAANKEKAAHEA